MYKHKEKMYKCITIKKNIKPCGGRNHFLFPFENANKFENEHNFCIFSRFMYVFNSLKTYLVGLAGLLRTD